MQPPWPNRYTQINSNSNINRRQLTVCQTTPQRSAQVSPGPTYIQFNWVGQGIFFIAVGLRFVCQDVRHTIRVNQQSPLERCNYCGSKYVVSCVNCEELPLFRTLLLVNWCLIGFAASFGVGHFCSTAFWIGSLSLFGSSLTVLGSLFGLVSISQNHSANVKV